MLHTRRQAPIARTDFDYIRHGEFHTIVNCQQNFKLMFLWTAELCLSKPDRETHKHRHLLLCTDNMGLCYGALTCPVGRENNKQ